MTKARSNATAPNAKGTLVVGNGTDASTTLAVASTAGFVLTVDSAEATGLKWAAAATSTGPAFQVTLTNNQALANASTWYTVGFDSEVFDTDNCFNTTNYRFTPNKAGYYWIYTEIMLAAASAGRMIVAISKNGSEYCRVNDINPAPNAEWYIHGGIIMYFNGTTDWTDLSAWMNGNATRNVVADSNYKRTRFEGYFIRS